MTVEQIWFVFGIIGAFVFPIYFDLHLLIGGIIGAFIGLIITSTLKILNFKFGKSADYSNSNKNNNSCCDDWD